MRNETWESIQDRLTGMRQAVLSAWVSFGPCTTEELAQRSGISILSLRPRTTELYALGFVELIAAAHTCGVYRAVPVEEAQRRFEEIKRQIPADQPTLL